jgi:hypothetical protein
VLANCLDGGGYVAAFDEQAAGRVDHGSTCEARASLTTLAVVWRHGLDGLGHETIVSLSIREYQSHSVSRVKE